MEDTYLKQLRMRCVAPSASRTLRLGTFWKRDAPCLFFCVHRIELLEDQWLVERGVAISFDQL